MSKWYKVKGIQDEIEILNVYKETKDKIYFISPFDGTNHEDYKKNKNRNWFSTLEEAKAFKKERIKSSIEYYKLEMIKYNQVLLELEELLKENE